MSYGFIYLFIAIVMNLFQVLLNVKEQAKDALFWCLISCNYRSGGWSYFDNEIWLTLKVTTYEPHIDSWCLRSDTFYLPVHLFLMFILTVSQPGFIIHISHHQCHFLIARIRKSHLLCRISRWEILLSSDYLTFSPLADGTLAKWAAKMPSVSYCFQGISGALTWRERVRQPKVQAKDLKARPKQ